MKQSVITRFAPSPTGFLHIGGARTALFNWLYSQKNQGEMLLRIEDTDQKRSSQQAVDAILESLKWLNLNWKGEAVSQMKNQKRHLEIAEQLIKNDKAYYCYTSSEELENLRKEASERSEKFVFKSKWRNEKSHSKNENSSPVIRLKVPEFGETIIQDKLLGNIVIANKEIDDFVLVRSDNTPTYMLSVVVDDHDMNVNMIIRGDDHLTNAAKQILIYQAMNWEIPQMVHIPLIHAEDGTKLSKRHGALGVEKYRAMGYLSQALCNHLARLGWSHQNKEIMNLEEMCHLFSLKELNKSPARFDFQKLNFINQYYMRSMSDECLLNESINFLQYYENGTFIKEKLNDEIRGRLIKAMPFLKERSKTLVELWKNAEFLFHFPYTDSQEDSLSSNEKKLLFDLNAILKCVEDESKENFLNTLKNYAKENNIKFSEIAPLLRKILAGKAISFNIGDILYALGKTEILRRIKKHLT